MSVSARTVSREPLEYVAHTATRLPPGVASVLSVLSSSAVVLDSEDRVLQASVAAQAFGLVKNDELVVQELLALARQVRRDGEIREGEMEVSTDAVGGGATGLAVRGPPRSGGARGERATGRGA